MLNYQRTEYGRLKKVLLCKPEHFRILSPINVIQEKNFESNIDTEKACKEHEGFIKALEDEGVEVILGKNHERYPYQVNTRDLGVTTPKGIVFGRFNTPYRWGEHRLIEETFKENDIFVYDKHTEGVFEGGDFMYLDEKTAAVGIGLRTDLVGVRQLQNTLSDFGIDVIPVDFSEEFLHLDMIMNVIGEKTAVICEGALPEEFVKLLREKDFTLINVTKEDVFLHKCNLLSVGNKTIMSHHQAEDVNEQLEDLGFKVIQLNLKEVLKSGGGPRCMSFPLLRE